MRNRMTPYGPNHPDYPHAPKDWDGGPYLCRDGYMWHMRGYGWRWGEGCWASEADWDRVGYTAVTGETVMVEVGDEENN